MRIRQFLNIHNGLDIYVSRYDIHTPGLSPGLCGPVTHALTRSLTLRKSVCKQVICWPWPNSQYPGVFQRREQAEITQKAFTLIDCFIFVICVPARNSDAH